MNREDSLSWYDAQKSAFMDGFYELLKLRTSKIIMLSRIAYYVRILSILQPQHSDFYQQRTIVIALPQLRFR